MTDMELAEEIKTWLNAGKFYSQLALSRPQWQQIIAAFRRGHERCVYPEECKHYGRCIKPDDHDNPPPCERPPSGEMVMVLKEVNSRFEELFYELPRDSAWWTAGNRRAMKTWDKVRAMIAEASKEAK